jgi:prolyl oligopeptidase
MRLTFLMLLTITACQRYPEFRYPDFAKSDVVDDFHGTPVADPWRGLEDPNSDATKAWVDAQNAITFPYLKSLKDRDAIETRLTELWDYEKFGTPFTRGSSTFYFRNDGLQNQSVLYKRIGDGEPDVLIDPNTFSEDGTISLTMASPSEDGRYLAYGISSGGSDWNEYKVRDVATGLDLPDHIKWVKFSDASWAADGSGFYYSRYPEPGEGEKLTGANRNHMLYFHKLGTPQSQDVLVYARPDQPDWGFGATATEDGNWLLISVWQGTENKNRVYVKDLLRGTPVRPLLDAFDASYDYILNEGSVFYFSSNNNAPNNRVIAVDVTKPDPANWLEIVPEQPEVLTGIRAIGGTLVAQYLKDARSLVKVLAMDGTFVREVDLPTIGTVGGFSGRKSDTIAYYNFSSFTYPNTIFRYDVSTGVSEAYRTPQVTFNPADYETQQVFYTSKDGTQVPMFITHKKGLTLNGTNPTYLYGYGGFNISITPSFSISNLAFMERGGVYAVPNLRGGGEYGQEWHEAGTKERKQNVFDDFIAAAEYLISEGYTSSNHLAIGGGSNGGLLVGAVMTQRPELFRVALPAVGVLDMLRYHTFTIGWAWASDYGLSTDPDGFNYLMAYSPLHNVKAGVRYPSTMITTGDHDDRVVPAHSYKFAAELQSKHAGDNPVLIRIETRAGHGAGKPTKMVIEEQADRLAFMFAEFGR